jgi:hypothetical protein
MKEVIKEILESEFEKELFDAAMANLNDDSNKLRYNNFAYSIRELSRHFLHRLSPEDDVKSCQWFEILTVTGNLTRTQRIKYAIHGGLTDEILTKLGFDVEELKEEIKSIKSTIDSLSKYTHINEETFDLPKSEIDLMSGNVLRELKAFVERVKSCKRDLTQFLDCHIEQHILEEIIFNNYENVGSLARRYSIESGDVIEYQITEINYETITVDLSGNIDFVLEYGSNKEIREGDGLDINISFPFQTKIHYLIEEEFPSESYQIDDFGVNTDSWYDDEPLEDANENDS